MTTLQIATISNTAYVPTALWASWEPQRQITFVRDQGKLGYDVVVGEPPVPVNVGNITELGKVIAEQGLTAATEAVKRVAPTVNEFIITTALTEIQRGINAQTNLLAAIRSTLQLTRDNTSYSKISDTTVDSASRMIRRNGYRMSAAKFVQLFNTVRRLRADCNIDARLSVDCHTLR